MSYTASSIPFFLKNSRKASGSSFRDDLWAKLSTHSLLSGVPEVEAMLHRETTTAEVHVDNQMYGVVFRTFGSKKYRFNGLACQTISGTTSMACDLSVLMLSVFNPRITSPTVPLQHLVFRQLPGQSPRFTPAQPIS